jgi:hypothetical protein
MSDCPGCSLDTRPLRRREIGISGWFDDPSSDEHIIPFPQSCFRASACRNQLSDHPAVGGDRNAFAGFGLTHKAAQAILELADARGNHVGQYSHMWPYFQDAPALVSAQSTTATEK